MVNSAIGDHGNERRHTSSTPPHPLSVSLSLSPSLFLYLYLLLYDLLCLGQGWCLCQARPRQKDRSHSWVQPKTLTVSCLFGIWPHNFSPHPFSLCACVCACVCACMRACVCLFVCCQPNYTLRLVENTAAV